MSTISKLAKSPIPPLALLLASSAAWVAFQADSGPAADSSPSSPDGVFYLQPLEQRASQTVRDWAAAADLIVTAEVTSEQAIEPPQSETVTGDELDLLGRTVSLKITDVIWRSETATEPNPTVLTMDAFGSMRAADGSTRKAAAKGAARLEPGHSYIMALHWAAAQCSPGDETVPAHWSALGSGAVLPADGNKIGVGEFQGGRLDLVENPADPRVTPGSALAKFAGKSPAAMEVPLDQAATTSVREPDRNTCQE